jgi:hypothetical protein
MDMRIKSWTFRVMVAACLAVAGTTEVWAQAETVLRATDPATGAEVRVSGGGAGVVLELAAPGVTLTKRSEAGRVVTVVRTAKDELTVEASRSAIVVSGRGGRVEVTSARPDRLREAQAVIARSTAASDAARLLGRVSFGQFSPLTLTLLSTRNMLLGSAEAAEGRRAQTELLQQLTAQPRVLRVSSQSSPTDCWDKYVREAIAAFTEYEDCLRNSGFWGDFACDIVYDMRAIGAFYWWAKCNAIKV